MTDREFLKKLLLFLNEQSCAHEEEARLALFDSAKFPTRGDPRYYAGMRQAENNIHLMVRQFVEAHPGE